MCEGAHPFEQRALQRTPRGDIDPRVAPQSGPRPLGSQDVRKLDPRVLQEDAQLIGGMGTELGGDRDPAGRHLFTDVAEDELLD